MNKTINHIILEDIIGQFKDNIEIVYAVDKSKHGEERQTRHQDTQITDEQVIDAINTAMDDIVEALIFNRVDVAPGAQKSNRVWIYDSMTNLNVVVGLEKSQETGKIQVKVVTVMITPNFNNKFNTYKVTI